LTAFGQATQRKSRENPPAPADLLGPKPGEIGRKGIAAEFGGFLSLIIGKKYQGTTCRAISHRKQEKGITILASFKVEIFKVTFKWGSDVSIRPTRGRFTCYEAGNSFRSEKGFPLLSHLREDTLGTTKGGFTSLREGHSPKKSNSQALLSKKRRGKTKKKRPGNYTQDKQSVKKKKPPSGVLSHSYRRERKRTWEKKRESTFPL